MAKLALGVGVVLVAVGLAGLLHRVLDVARGAPIQGIESPSRAWSLSSVGFASGAGHLANVAFRAGHTVEVLADAEIFARLLEDLGGAQRSITLLPYYCEPGRLADRVVTLLAERATAGVDVRFLADGFGCGPLPREARSTLEAAGVRLAVLRPVRWHALHRAQHRNHARSVVVDGRLAYAGGFGISDRWLPRDAGGEGWRDTGVRFTGPSVRDAQAMFLAAWAEATGSLPTGPDLLPPVAPDPGMEPAAPVRAGLLRSGASVGTTPAERYLALTIAGAERTLFITNSYFVPTPSLRRLLVDAARRGVDVRVLVPGRRTDVRTTRWAGRGFYEELLAGGIRIWEYRPTMMHAKTLVADGAWAMVGSFNFDNRSLRLNDEAALLIHDATVGTVLDSLFLEDLRRADPVTLAGHRARPWWERVVEGLARVLTPLL